MITGYLPSPTGRNTSQRSSIPSSIGIGASHVIRMELRVSSFSCAIAPPLEPRLRQQLLAAWHRHVERVEDRRDHDVKARPGDELDELLQPQHAGRAVIGALAQGL